jgi:hypothetical protein
VADYGGPELRSEDLDGALEHDRWQYDDACEHQDCVLLHHWIGNIARVAALRECVHTLSSDPKSDFPVIWCKVIYSGTHAGDFLTLNLVQQLQDELQRLRHADMSVLTRDDAQRLIWFIDQMEDLVQAALTVGKPICF